MRKVTRIKLDEAIESWNQKNPEKRKKTRDSVAEAIGVNYHSLSRMANGSIGKGMQTLSSLAQELDITVDELLELEP